MMSRSSAETKKIGARLARRILKSRPHQKHARVIALSGDLGAGKTTFVQGFAAALGLKHRMVSPTFLIFRNYPLSAKSYKFFYHVDVYRIQKIQELKVLSFQTVLRSPSDIVLIEWAEKIKKMLPKDTIWVQFQHGRKENERLIAY